MTRPRFGLAMGNYNVPSAFDPPSKRGGSGTNALTNTLDPSLYPTAPPPSKFVAGVPKIGGSQAGFIGLIVGLGIFIILCCCAVFYLLHTRPHGGRAGNKNHPISSSAPTGLFASRRKRNAGWVQQTDEFDYDSAEDVDLVGKKDATRYGDGGSGYTGYPMHDELKAFSAPPALSHGANADAYTDPFDPERLPESVRRQQAPLPATAREPTESRKAADHSPKESPTTPSFEGGTKFREQF
ncbi:hypothetical protein JB92DRAFT_3038468 [Gautieria morchelliformis]|nr:hypothetical protein JB92DRAFT_3038468 [Gautieria morchelliformis]